MRPSHNNASILVASYAYRHRLVHQDMSALPTSTNSQRPNPSYRRYARSSVRKDLCRHDAPAEVWRFPISYPRSMFANSLPRVSYASKGDRNDYRDWLFEDILCRWGGLTEIVSDNGPPFIKALDYWRRSTTFITSAFGLQFKSQRTRRAKLTSMCGQALFKSVDGDQSKWSQGAYSVFWADRVTIRRRMGCSPYFAATGTHPILPLDIAESYLPSSPTYIDSFNHRPHRDSSYCLTETSWSPIGTPLSCYGSAT